MGDFAYVPELPSGEPRCLARSGEAQCGSPAAVRSWWGCAHEHMTSPEGLTFCLPCLEAFRLGARLGELYCVPCAEGAAPHHCVMAGARAEPLAPPEDPGLLAG